MINWPFSDPPNAAVITTRSIAERGACVAEVSHDAEDGGWQFHDADQAAPREEDAMVVSLRSMVERDQTLTEVADLQEGWRAWREAADGPWQRAPNPRTTEQ